jgi:UDP-N-acetylmuramoyl-L-alanyl-D-glutamate--2,6-diaminopimelate ligase
MLQGAQIDPPAGLPAIDVTGLTADSRAVTPGCLFAALPGAMPGSRSDGRQFIADAVARGAAAVLAPTGTPWPEGVPPRPLILDPEPRRVLARLAALHAGGQPATVAAVTGTNGKTSTVEFLRQIMQPGRPSASLGTLGVIAPGRAGGGGLTTPDPVALAQTLAVLAQEGVQFAALEASSHGLDQFRLDGVRLAAAGFSNLTRDHLDYHGSMAAYRAAKLRLFDALLPPGAAAVAHSALEPETLDALHGIASRRGLALRTVGENGDIIRLLAATPHAAGQWLELVVAGARHSIDLPLPGRFQADNALLAAGLALALGESAALDRLQALTGVRGRLELAATLPNGAAAYVDYAHTPDALERLLTALRPHTAGRLVLVFGAGGDRDRGKRPLMGAVAARLADAAIVTDDNPRSEDPAAIRAAVRAACPDGLEIGDRAAAIAAGLDMLRPGDVLVVAGKGHEQGQTIAGQTLPFDDAATIRRLAGLP